MLMSTLDGIELESIYPDLLGKRVLITGIDNEHGVDIARAFAEQRTRLVLHVNEMTPEMAVLGAIVAEGALDVRLFDGPIGATDAAVKLARQAVQAFGGVDIVINLATVPEPRGGAAARETDVEDAVSQALSAACLITKIATNRMRLTMTEGLVLTIAKLPRRPTLGAADGRRAHPLRACQSHAQRGQRVGPARHPHQRGRAGDAQHHGGSRRHHGRAGHGEPRALSRERARRRTHRPDVRIVRRIIALTRATTRSGNARAMASRVAAMTPRSVISPVTSRAGVTSNA